MKKAFRKILLGGAILVGVPSFAVMEVHDSSLQLLLTQNNALTESIASVNWTLGQGNSIFAQYGVTQSMYENFLNNHGLGGTKLGRYASSVFSKCISDKMGSWFGKLKVPSVTLCGTDIAADLANYLGKVLNDELNKALASWIGPKPEKKKSPDNPQPPGVIEIKNVDDSQLAGNLIDKNKKKIKDENGDKREIPLNKTSADVNGTLTYKDSIYYTIDQRLINTTPSNTVSSYMAITTTGDKENMGDINSPEIRAFYGKMARQYAQVNKYHDQQFLRHSYALKRLSDFFNTTFVKNKDKRIPEQYTIDVPIPIAEVEKSRKIGEGRNAGCMLTPDSVSQKLGGCYGLNFGISFIPERSIVENPSKTLKVYTKGVKDTGNKIIRKLLQKDGNTASKNFIEKFDIEKKIKEIKRAKGYKESGINFATLSQLITIYADTSVKLLNMTSPDGRDIAKINYLKAILYQLTILNEQAYLYNKVNASINTDRYNELYVHVLNIEKELQKIRRYETFYLQKILMK